MKISDKEANRYAYLISLIRSDGGKMLVKDVTELLNDAARELDQAKTPDEVAKKAGEIRGIVRVLDFFDVQSKTGEDKGG